MSLDLSLVLSPSQVEGFNLRVQASDSHLLGAEELEVSTLRQSYEAKRLEARRAILLELLGVPGHVQETEVSFTQPEEHVKEIPVSEPAGLTSREIAQALGYHKDSVNNWGRKWLLPTPAEAWLSRDLFHASGNKHDVKLTALWNGKDGFRIRLSENCFDEDGRPAGNRSFSRSGAELAAAIRGLLFAPVAGEVVQQVESPSEEAPESVDEKSDMAAESSTAAKPAAKRRPKAVTSDQLFPPAQGVSGLTDDMVGKLV
jgi:hypothetical protein